MRMNISSAHPLVTASQPKTHEGAKATSISPEQALRRSVLSCFLFEKEFYEDGVSISERITALCSQVSPSFVAALAIEARTKHNLRHVPLLLCSVLADISKGSSLVPDTIEKVISRADELTEILAIHSARKNVLPGALKGVMTHGLKKGISRAFNKFTEYQFARNKVEDRAIKLRDALFLSHAKPKDDEARGIFSRIIDGTLKTPDTWQVELSAGKDKKETFERLLKEGKLGGLDVLRNLRNMAEAGCDEDLVREAINNPKKRPDFPFRYIAAARAAPRFEPELDKALSLVVEGLPKLSGLTAVLVDVSGSMDAKLSGKSDLTRIDAAAALASIINGNRRIFSFSNKVVEVPPRTGMAGIDVISKSQPHGGTNLFEAIAEINKTVKYDRLIVISDEQAASSYIDRMPSPTAKGYLINVASYKNGVGYGKNWVHLDGFSENVIRYIYELESENRE